MWNEGSRHAPLLIAVLSRPSRKGCLAARSHGRHSCAASHYSGMQYPRCRTPYVIATTRQSRKERMMFFFFTEPNGLDGLGSRFLIDTSAYVSQLLIPSHACVRASSHQRRHRHALHCNANPTSPPSSREPAVFSAGELERLLAAALTPSIRSELQQSNKTPSLLLRPPLDSSPVLSESHISTTPQHEEKHLETQATCGR